MRVVVLAILLAGCTGPNPAIEAAGGPAAGAAPTVSVGGNLRGYWGAVR